VETGHYPTSRHFVQSPLQKVEAMNLRSYCINSGLAVLAAIVIQAPPAWAQTFDSSPRTVKLLKGARPAPTETTQRVFFSSFSGDVEELKQVRARLADAGAWRIHTFYPEVITCRLPVSVDPWSLVQGTAVSVRQQPDGATAVSRASIGARGLDWLPEVCATIDAAAAKDSRVFHEVPAAPAGGFDGGWRAIEAERAPMTPEEGRAAMAAAREDPLRYQNTEFLAGNILIRVVFPESKGGGQETWTEARRTAARQLLFQAVVNYWERYLPNVDLDWDWTYKWPAETQFEPINIGTKKEQIRPWVADVMFRLGFTGDESWIEKIHMYNMEGLNAYTKSDWVFTVFVVDAENDEDHWFDDARNNVYAEVGGPFMVLPFSTENQGSFDNMFMHGMAQVFWALPEDPGGVYTCGSSSGYLNFKTGNKVKIDPVSGMRLDCAKNFAVNCVARYESVVDFGYDGPPCDWTYGQLGYADDDRNQVPDVFDAPPAIFYEGFPIDTLIGTGQPIRFSVVAQAVPNANSQQPAPRRDYATPIGTVSYVLNGGIGPIYVTPEDGAMDELVEDFKVVIPFLLPGISYIEVYATNTYSAKSPPKRKNLLLLALDFAEFRKEQRNDGIGMAWDLRGKTFGAELELWRINYSADSLATLVASSAQLQPVAPPQNGYTPYYFKDRTVNPGADYGYYIVGTFEHFYQGEIREFKMNSRVIEVTASVPRGEGILSRPTPNPFLPSSMGDVMVSVEIPGASGVPLIRPTTGPRRAAAQVAGPEPIGLTVYVYDVVGRRVKMLMDDAVFDAVVNIKWDGTDSNGDPVPSGMYFIAARVGDVSDSRKVLIIR